MGLRLSAAILAGKLTALVSRVMGWKGSSLPGLVARKVYPRVLKKLGTEPRKGVIIVTGTNGKTTTNNMLARIVTGAGYKILHNSEGANLITGVTTGFVKAASVFGRINCDYALLEVDEASFPKVVREVKPQIVIITNFFRDQLDRYGELDTTITIVKKTLTELKGVHLVLNADDPLVAQFQRKTGLTATFYGLAGNERSSTAGSYTREAKFCPFCGEALQYAYYHYSQLGAFDCPGCGYKRPSPEVEAEQVKALLAGTDCKVRHTTGSTALHIPTGGFYNIYNALAAFTTGLLLKINPTQAAESLRGYAPAIGRMESFIYGEKPVLLNLVKNPTGFNESLAAVLAAPGDKDLFIAINDNDADGRDISWLWDVDFEILEKNHYGFTGFICSGKRAEEMAVRLKYAGVPTNKISITGDLEAAVNEVLEARGGAAYLLSTYTALWTVQKILLKQAEKGESNAHHMPSVS
ncbi:MurT ligase domain-containing protein [Desulfolucanica intricata]|uniref:MurT ligase domain-containing protein n=1 Tax=Desulfolucanica intricata TaxID=1285191 RepID=UPI00082FDDF9|nr:MurT ligase domain-containing protein [Desulfolucanica intricata]